MPNNLGNEPDSQAVIGKSLAFLCLHVSEIKKEPLSRKAKFLMGLGLSTVDAAGVLNTTPASINELFRQQRKKKGAKGAAKGNKHKGKK
jgi:hypothetical protein